VDKILYWVVIKGSRIFLDSADWTEELSIGKFIYHRCGEKWDGLQAQGYKCVEYETRVYEKENDDEK